MQRLKPVHSKFFIHTDKQKQELLIKADSYFRTFFSCIGAQKPTELKHKVLTLIKFILSNGSILMDWVSWKQSFKVQLIPKNDAFNQPNTWNQVMYLTLIIIIIISLLSTFIYLFIYLFVFRFSV